MTGERYPTQAQIDDMRDANTLADLLGSSYVDPRRILKTGTGEAGDGSGVDVVLGTDGATYLRIVDVAALRKVLAAAVAAPGGHTGEVVERMLVALGLRRP